MKRTEYKLLCGTANGYPVYRVVLTDGKHFFVRWNGKLINVDNDTKEFSLRYLR